MFHNAPHLPVDALRLALFTGRVLAGEAIARVPAVAAGGAGERPVDIRTSTANRSRQMRVLWTSLFLFGGAANAQRAPACFDGPMNATILSYARRVSSSPGASWDTLRARTGVPNVSDVATLIG